MKPALPTDKDDAECGMDNDFGHKKNQSQLNVSLPAQDETENKQRATDKIKKRHEFDMDEIKYKEKNEMKQKRRNR